MNRRNDSRMMEIYGFITDYIEQNGHSPSTARICEEMSLGKATVSKFVCRLIDLGMLERNGRYGLCTAGARNPRISIPIIGRVACGSPKLALEDAEGYLTVDRQIVGSGEFFALRADGESMINAGISDGDLVYIRRQSNADEGEIVVALITDEATGEPVATLKRFFKDKENSRYILHPENDSMSDIYTEELQILGVALHVLKRL